MNIIQELEEFISQASDARELKRAIAVKMTLSQVPTKEIQKHLGVSPSFVSKWKNQVLFHGIASLKLQHKGSNGSLTPSQRSQVRDWIGQQDFLRLSDLKRHLESKYSVVYESEQSYYNLLHEAKYTWKKTQKENPAKDEELVAKKKQEITQQITDWRESIETEKLAVFMIDECHLLFGDILGYAWGKSEERITVPIKNERERQTYYGALDYKTKEFFIQEHERGNTDNTIAFVKHLRTLRPGMRIAIFWDGAAYHDSKQFKEYLKEVNAGLPKEDWKVLCVKFAPNDPDQNPVEDVWLQGKRFLRDFYHKCNSFHSVKQLFKFFCDGQVFDFPKLFMYDSDPQMV